MKEGGHGDEVVNVLNSDIMVSEFELQSHYYVHFWSNILGKGMKSLISIQLYLWISIIHEGWFSFKQRSQQIYKTMLSC